VDWLLLAGRQTAWCQHHQGRHRLYIAPPQRNALLRDAHDNLGHKGFYSTRRTLADRFWWPTLEQDVKCYVDTCHQWQLRQTTKVCIPPVVATPTPLFRKAYIDTMPMPRATAINGYTVGPFHNSSG
jgi:Integrase zinc binding domain